MAWCFTDVSSHLLFVPAARQIADAYGSPSKLGHQTRKVPVSTCSPLALWDLQDIQESLRADALQAVEPCRPAHALQAQAPRVYVFMGFEFGGGSLHAFWK